jgi:hypothetical protein
MGLGRKPIVMMGTCIAPKIFQEGKLAHSEDSFDLETSVAISSEEHNDAPERHEKSRIASSNLDTFLHGAGEYRLKSILILMLLSATKRVESLRQSLTLAGEYRLKINDGDGAVANIL